MKDASYDAACGVCRHNAGEDPNGGDVVFENDLWLVRQRGRGVPGWMVIQTQRHVAGFAHFNDDEARNFGPAFHHFQKTLEELSGAMRIYTAALNETYPHFHCHFVPVYERMPLDAISWKVFELHRTPSIVPNPEDVARLTRDFREAMLSKPPPR
jgi:diadenosine tetraphosphate (Ap4A) HIT family hydrolase